MGAERKAVLVGYHPNHVIEAAERMISRHRRGESWYSTPEQKADHDLVCEYRQRKDLFVNAPVYVRELAFHRWVFYLVASEYLARTLDSTPAFPNGVPDAVPMPRMFEDVGDEDPGSFDAQEDRYLRFSG